jgi:hypothetical protein
LSAKAKGRVGGWLGQRSDAEWCGIEPGGRGKPLSYRGAEVARWFGEKVKSRSLPELGITSVRGEGRPIGRSAFPGEKRRVDCGAAKEGGRRACLKTKDDFYRPNMELTPWRVVSPEGCPGAAGDVGSCWATCSAATICCAARFWVAETAAPAATLRALAVA